MTCRGLSVTVGCGHRRAAAANDPGGVAALADWQTEQGLTQMDVATALSVEPGIYSSCERKHAAIPAYVVRRLAARFGAVADRLLRLHLPSAGEGDAA